MSSAKGGLISSPQIIQPLLDSPATMGMDSFVVNVLPVRLVSAPINVLMVGWVMRCLTSIWMHSWTTGINISLSWVRILGQWPRPPPDKDRVHVIYPMCWTHPHHVGFIRRNHHCPHAVVAHTHCHLAFWIWLRRRRWGHGDLLAVPMVRRCGWPSADLLCWVCRLGHARRLTVYSGVAYWGWFRNVTSISTVVAVATEVGILGVGLETEEQ